MPTDGHLFKYRIQILLRDCNQKSGGIRGRCKHRSQGLLTGNRQYGMAVLQKALCKHLANFTQANNHDRRT
jgi:hypothetical protein